MAHFAKLGVNGKVIAVHGLDNDQMLNADGQEDESVGQNRLQQIHGWPAQMWIQTSYNTRGNKYYDADGSEGDQSKKLPGLLNISFPGTKSSVLMKKLDREGISVSNGSACGSGDIKPSPVLSAIGLDDITNLSTLRFSFGSSNTNDQIDYLLSKLESMLSET